MGLGEQKGPEGRQGAGREDREGRGSSAALYPISPGLHLQIANIIMKDKQLLGLKE